MSLITSCNPGLQCIICKERKGNEEREKNLRRYRRDTFLFFSPLPLDLLREVDCWCREKKKKNNVGGTPVLYAKSHILHARKELFLNGRRKQVKERKRLSS